MRKRKWILVVAIVVGAVVVGGYWGWRLTGADEKIKQALLARIRPLLAQDSDIEKVEMGLRSIHFKGVLLVPKDRSFALQIDDVRLGYSLWNILKYRFVPYKVAHDVVLTHPVVIVRKNFQREEMHSVEEELADFQGAMDELETVRRITVADAEVAVEDSSGNRVRLAHSLDGWFDSVPIDSATVRLEGNLFESDSKNLKVVGQMNLPLGRPLRMQVLLQESEPSSELPFFLPSYIQVTAGKMWGEVDYDWKGGASGFLEIRDGSFSFRKAQLSFDNVNVKGILEGRNVLLEGTIEKFNGSPLTISGKMENILDPQLDLSILCSRFDIPAFFQNAIPKSRISLSGKAQFGMHITGPLNNSMMRGDFVSKDLKAYGVLFDRFQGNMSLCDSVLTIQGKGTQKEGLDLALQGKMDFSTSRQQTSLALNVNGNFLSFLPSWSQERLARCGTDMTIRLAGPLSDLTGEVSGSLHVVSVEGDTLELLPKIVYANRDLGMAVQSNRQFRIDGHIQSPFYGNTQWEIRTQGMESLLSLMADEKFRKAINEINVKFVLSGSPKIWEISGQGVNEEGRKNPRVFDAKLSSQRVNKQSKIKLDAVYFGAEGGELPVRAQGTLTESGISLHQCEIGDFVSMEGQYPFNPQSNFTGRIKLVDFSFEKLHPIFTQLKPYRGEIQGEIIVRGTRTQPNVDFGMTLHKGYFHAMGIFEGDLRAQWDNRKFGRGSISFQKNGIPLIEGEVQRTNSDSLDGMVLIKDMNFREFSLALTGKEMVKGEGNGEIRVRGKIETPRILGSVAVHNGSFGAVTFNKAQVDVVDTLMKENRVAEGSFWIQDGRFEREDGLKVQFWGNLPHGKARDADISVLAQGNILGFLSEVSGLVRKAKGSGEVFLRWGGRPGDWVLGGGRIGLDQGEMELTSFVKKIKALRCKAELQEGDRFVQISDFSGEVDGGKFMLANTSENANARDLPPLDVEEMGIHFGHLQLETDEKGIRMYLPGLMEKGESGWLLFKGKDPGKPFIFTGPASFPTFRGTLNLRDIRVTYPFLSLDEDSGTNKIVEFLRRIHWDLRIVPQKEAHYVRNIGSPLGNIYADFQLQEGIGELNLEGIVQEGDFQVWGHLVSSEGHIDVLDHYFRPERITFDYPKGADEPIIAGRAYTTITDSMGMPSTVWLNMIATDDVTGMQKEGGPWKKIQFRFSSDNPNLGRTEADLLEAMGYSEAKFKDRAYDALGMSVENLVFRPIFRPIERGIRRHLGLDVVRVYSMFTRNIVQIQTMDGFSFDPKFLFRSTRLTLGKYLAPRLFLIYAGQVQSDGIGFHYLTHGIGFRHALSLEYTIRPDLYLQMEYIYDSQLLSDRREDKRIWIRHIFPF